MNCKNCGAEIDEKDSFCPYCGEKHEQIITPNTVHREGNCEEEVSEAPNTTLWIIIGVLSALFCCMIGGIVTTVYAAKASGNVSAGDIELAKHNIKNAKTWFITTIVIGIVTNFIAICAGMAY